MLKEIEDGSGKVMVRRQQTFALGDDAVPVVVGVAGERNVEAVLHPDQSLHRVDRGGIHPDAPVPIHRHEPERLIHGVAHDRQIEVIALRDGRPVMDAGPAERVHAQVEARAADGVHVEDVPQVADVGVEIVVPVRRAARSAFA